MPRKAPVRVDFAGGWLDHPKYAREGAHIVNLSIGPFVHYDRTPYHHSSGLGGSAAWEVLRGRDAVGAEMAKGSGWQDAAVILETGLCSWASGPLPRLEVKTDPSFLNDRLALLWTKPRPCDAGLLNTRPRDYPAVEEASWLAYNGVVNRSFLSLAAACEKSYYIQLDEGMDELPDHGQVAKKYSGAGWGGYALYMFNEPSEKCLFMLNVPGAMHIHPFMADRTLYAKDTSESETEQA